MLPVAKPFISASSKVVLIPLPAIDVICDCAQPWGGALYIRKGMLAKIAPYPGETDPDSVYSRVHTATSNFAAFMSVPAALDFHQGIGGTNKEMRLKYLRD